MKPELIITAAARDEWYRRRPARSSTQGGGVMTPSATVPSPSVALARLRQVSGDLSSVRLTTPAGELQGAYALGVFEALQEQRGRA